MRVLRQAQKKRGIYFVSTLVVAVLVGMFITSAILVSRSTLSGSAHLVTGGDALRAAESGLRYAQARLGDDPGWSALGPRSTTISLPDQDMVVVEDSGNVIGLIRADNGSYSQFRIRFNWQDDAQGNEDGIDDPPADFWINSSYVSVNNLAGGSEMEVPRADAANSSVAPDSPRPYAVPAGSVCLIVEGRSGHGLNQLSPSNLNPENGKGQTVTTRILESYLRVASQPGSDAAAQAGGNLVAEMPNNDKALKVEAKVGLPRVRSKEEVRVEGGDPQDNYISPEGEVYFNSDFIANILSEPVTEVNEDAEGGDFYKLGWDDVKTAEPGDETLPAGTYVVWDDGTLHYYSMNFEDYETFIETPGNQSNPGVVMLLDNDAVKFDGSKLEIKKNLFIEPTLGVDEFNFLPRKGAQEDPHDDPDSSGLPASAAATLSSNDAQLYNFLLAYQGGPSGEIEIQHPGGGELELSWEVDGSVEFESEDTSLTQEDMLRYLWGDTGSYPEWGPDSEDPPLPFDPATAASTLGIEAGSTGMDTFDLDEVAPSELDKSAEDLTVEFKPGGGETAILSADGNVRLGSKVKGKGGSITSASDIKLIGAGSDLEASIEEGLNLYAKGDIVLSALKPKDDGTYEYKDFKMKGVIYTWGDFTAKIGSEAPSVTSWGKFELQGTLVAYGGDPSLENPGTTGSGNIEIRANEAKLKFDPAYLGAIQRAVNPARMRETFRTLHQ